MKQIKIVKSELTFGTIKFFDPKTEKIRSCLVGHITHAEIGMYDYPSNHRILSEEQAFDLSKLFDQTIRRIGGNDYSRRRHFGDDLSIEGMKESYAREVDAIPVETLNQELKPVFKFAANLGFDIEIVEG